MIRQVHGICSSEAVIDHSPRRDGTDYRVVLSRGLALATPLPLLLNHGSDPVGRVNHLRLIDGDKVYCRATIFDTKVGQEIWRQVENFQLRGLSIGVVCDRHEIGIDPEIGVIKYVFRSRLTEISLTPTPGNRDCFLRIFAGSGASSVAGQRSLPQHQQINERARKLVEHLNKQYPGKAENKPKRPPSKPQKLTKDGLPLLPPHELARIRLARERKRGKHE